MSEPDLFVPLFADLPLRDQQDLMERPFFSLAKTPRHTSINYDSPDGTVRVRVIPNRDFGMATIWDLDILIYCGSLLVEMKRRGVNDIPRVLVIQPAELLRAIGKPIGGRQYQLLKAALDRLASTIIQTNVRSKTNRDDTFSWIAGYTQILDASGQHVKGIKIEMQEWFYRGALDEKSLLAIDQAFFKLTGGREKWLWRTARKHAGGNPDGFKIRLSVLFDKSGAEGSLSRFKREIRKIAAANALPGIELDIETNKRGEELLVMKWVGVDAKPPMSASISKAKKSTKQSASAKAEDDTSPVSKSQLDSLVRKTKWAMQPVTPGHMSASLDDDLLQRLSFEFLNWSLEDLKRLRDEFLAEMSESKAAKTKNFPGAFRHWLRLKYEA